MLAQSIINPSFTHSTPFPKVFWLILRVHGIAQVYYPSNISGKGLMECGYVKFTGSFPTSKQQKLDPKQVIHFSWHEYLNVWGLWVLYQQNVPSMGVTPSPLRHHCASTEVPCLTCSLSLFCWCWNADLPMWLFPSTVKVSTVFYPPHILWDYLGFPPLFKINCQRQSQFIS